MGAFKIQTDLDLSGFNLLNFCIQSYTDLENVPNLGLGRKLFFTGNSTDEKNLREVIWDGVEWKAAAYLDDIEAITNGEGSLGTRVKALEDMLGLEDVTDVIDTWNDVKAFFANVDEGLDLMTMLDGKAEWNRNIPSDSFKTIGYGTTGANGWKFNGPALSFGANSTYYAQLQINFQADQVVFRRHTTEGFTDWQTIIHTGNALDMLKGTFLPLTGGTIDGRLTVNSVVSGDVTPLRVQTTEGSSTMMFCTTDSYIYFGYREGTGLFVTNEGGWSTAYPLLHAGNIGNYKAGDSDKLNGETASAYAKFSADIPLDGTAYKHIGYGKAASGYPLNGGCIAAGTSGGYIMYLHGRNGVLSFNTLENGALTGWKTIAFTDSDITGNAATATKLAKAVYIWGNEFDGTQSLNGNFFMSSGKKVYLSSPEGETIASLGISSNGQLFIGEGTNYSTNTIDTYLNGYNIYFRTGANQTAMTITEDGNVLVGTGTPHENAQLFSGGLTHVYGYAATPTLGSTPSTGLIVGSAGNGLAMWSTSGAGSFMQAEYFDGTSTALALILNPLGGAVNVGDGGLNVAGIAAVATTLTVGASDGTSAAAIYLQRASNNYIWANKAGGTLHLGVADSGNTSNANASLSIASDKIYPGIRNNAVSLGTSSYRWSNVYSVGGDFSGRVFIGSADDDTHSALLVKGGLGVTGNMFVYSNDKSSRIVTTIADNIARIYSLSQDGSVARDMYFGDYSGKGVKIIGGSRVLIGGATDDENYKLITNGAIKIGRSNYTDTYLGITISDTLATFDGNDGDGYMNYSFKSNGNNLLFLTGKSGGTSIFYTPTFFENLATFNGGALIPTGQKMTFGANGPTMEYDADANAIKVTGNIYATGTMASGGKAAEGEGDTGGGGNANVYSDVLEGVITQEWEVGNPFQKEDVIVSLYMWNTDESRWEMVLADIGVTSENIWVTFGRPTSTTDKYMAVVMG